MIIFKSKGLLHKSLMKANYSKHQKKCSFTFLLFYCIIPCINKSAHVVLLSFSHHSVLWMDHLFNLLQLPQHWPHSHPHHQQTLQRWLHSYWCVRQKLLHTVMNREEEHCLSFRFKALTQSAEYFMMSRLLSVIISVESEQQTATIARLNFST